MKKLKILSAGYEAGKDNKYGIIDGHLCQKESFSEYDVLIIDPTNMDIISDSAYLNLLKEYLKRRPEEIKLLLERTGGIVICFLRKKMFVAEPIHRYTWLPQKGYPYPEYKGEYWYFSPDDFNLVPREGREVKDIDKTNPFSQYFEAFKNDLSFEVIIDKGEGILKFSKIIAKSRVGDIIGFELPFGPGKFIFLPPPSNTIDKDKLFGVLLDCIKKSFEWTEPLNKPDWLNKYPLDKNQEKEIEKSIKSVENKIDKMQSEKQKLENERKRFEFLKSLLYEQGKFGLELPVREAFRILGFNVLESDDYDLYIKEGELWIIGEIEGSRKPIYIEKLNQLNTYVSQERIKGDECKGILIGNGYIEKEPDERGEQFTDGAIKACKSLNYCRMTTYELFKAVRAVLSEPNNKELRQGLKERILKCEGEFKLRETKRANSS